MIEYFKLKNVGPSTKMMLEFGSRLNLLTGDNGLGKTFALDIAWWALTRTWPGVQALPRLNKPGEPIIEYQLQGKKPSPEPVVARFDRKKQSWKCSRGRPSMPGLVIYVRVDGGFSVWDPARNYWKTLTAREYDNPDRPAAFHFSRDQLWEGLKTNGTSLCNGLLQDWISWQYRQTDLFQKLTAVLEGLSPSDKELLRPGEPVRSSPLDAQEKPTLELPYGTIPVTIASAGIRRILALAYVLVWTWSEHKAASSLLQQKPTDRLVVLIDEVEAHLHPQWQRVLLPSVLDVASTLYADIFEGHVQILATTHAPLVLASVESHFSEIDDRLISFDLSSSGKVEVHNQSWSKQGDVLNWLVSSAFGLKQARSKEAELAIEAAEAFMRGDEDMLPVEMNTKQKIDNELRRLLPGHDPFWPRWIVLSEEEAK